MQKLTKHDTILWINHAIAYFKGLGKTQKDLALNLGIEESRMSEMKNGSGTVSPALMENIVNLCGAPRRKSGRFEEVELYSDLDSFFSQFNEVTENRFFRQLLKTFTSNTYIDLIIKNCTLEDNSYEYTNDDDNKALKISRINELIRSAEFNELCLQYIDDLNKRNPTSKIMNAFKWENCEHEKNYYRGNYFKMNGLCIYSINFFHAMYLQWLLVNRFDNYRFVSDEPVNLNPIKDLSPVVLTGNKLLTITNNRIEQNPINQGSKDLFGISDNYHQIHERLENRQGNIESSNKVSHKPDMWKDVRCELYLSENMNYHLLIHLSPKNIFTYLDMDHFTDSEPVDDNLYLADIEKDDRAAVIMNINTLDLFRQMEEIRKWCGLEQDCHFRLKQKIAKAGGYVPGARVLV